MSEPCQREGGYKIRSALLVSGLGNKSEAKSVKCTTYDASLFWVILFRLVRIPVQPRSLILSATVEPAKPVRQRGSHIIVENDQGSFAMVPRKDEVKPGTLLSIIDQAGLTKDEFLDLI